MKRYLLWVLTAVLILSCLIAFPDEARAVSVIASGGCGDDLVWSLTDGGILTISGTGKMNDYSFSASNTPWYNLREQITRIVIKEGITSIGEWAFDHCSSLTSIIIPDSVTSIGEGAIQYCSSLTSIILPDGITSIEYSTFYNCSSLTSVIIPDSVTSIGAAAFYQCENLTSIVIPDGVTNIGDTAFYRCNSLTSIEIPKNVTSIGVQAFVDCANLIGIWVDADNAHYSCDSYGVLFNKNKTELIQVPGGISGSYVVPEGATSIGRSAFQSCSDLTSIVLQEGVTDIGFMSFYDCINLTSITIPESVTSIGNAAFVNCSSLESIMIPEGISGIGNSVFSVCNNLTSITIPENVTSIGDYAFYKCTALETIYYHGTTAEWEAIPKGTYWDKDCNYTLICRGDVKTSEGLAYTLSSDGTYYIVSGIGTCTDTEIVIPSTYNGKTVSAIGEYAFYDCRNLTSITIPDGVTSIGDSAFDSCSSLTSIEIPDSVTGFGFATFACCSSLTSIEIPAGVTSIGVWAFAGCSSLTSIEIPDSVTSIGNSAFGNCSSLMSVTIGDGVTSIGYEAFGSGDSLIGIWVDEDNACYSSDGYGVLFNKTKSELIRVPSGFSGGYIIPASVTSIGDLAFDNCSRLTSVAIPDSVTTIGTCAFYDCSSLTSITIPDSVTSIGGSAFHGCSSLETIVIPFVGGSKKTSTDSYQYPFGYIFGANSYTDGVATKQYYYGSSTSSTTFSTYYIPASLKSVTVTGGNILYGAFSGCRDLTSITLLDSVTSIGDSAFDSCSSLTSIEIPDSVTGFGFATFACCSSLTSVEIPAGVTSIGVWAFAGCSSLTSIEIPDSVTSIGNSAFGNCSSLSTVFYRGSIEDREQMAVDSSDIYLHNAKWHYEVKETYHDGKLCYRCEECALLFFLDGNEVEHDYCFERIVEYPTCIKQGYASYICHCGDRCVDSYVEALGHEFGVWETIKEPDYLENGLKERHCCRCDVVESLEIPNNPFPDVGANHSFKKFILWGYYEGIVGGDRQGYFNPDKTVTRGQFIIMLWRAAGEPTPTQYKAFPDVSENSTFYKAVCWAVEQGITNGKKDGTFGVNDECTRGHVVLFLYRFAGSPATEGNISFPDVTGGTYYNAVCWAAENGITSGQKDGTFGVGLACKRMHAMKFLNVYCTKLA